MSTGLTQTTVSVNLSAPMAQVVGKGSTQTINADTAQTPCLRLKAAWLLGSRYIRIKKITPLFISNFLFHTRMRPPSYKTPVFCMRQSFLAAWVSQ